MDAFLGKMFACRLDLFAGYSQACALTDRFFVIEAFANGNRQTASRDLQIDRLVQTGAAVFLKDILSGDTEIGSAILDVCRHVGGTDDDDAYLWFVGRQNQFS